MDDREVYEVNDTIEAMVVDGSANDLIDDARVAETTQRLRELARRRFGRDPTDAELLALAVRLALIGELQIGILRHKLNE